VAALLEEVKGLAFKNKKAAAFGCYGWSGESVKVITEKLKEGGFEVLNDGIRALWTPDQQAREDCLNYGKNFAALLK